ncbi:DoxX family protein [Thermoleptolyngbya oregonensis NK1-22]|uniref:DoxX family protein n=1 Tax=Thermoleptolyngbya oregonensis NK1-22 TaxID=2547457 RepID=A0AA97BAR9_9CYAN|nr:DoxX family protein [Thermoleptolyngbya oregonensis]WOB45055.1 DoxX family protein [Thermoleptolyngbya oregonensis NK1-22]
MNTIQRATGLLSAVLRPNLTPNYPSQLAWTVLRVIAGVVMIHNGLDKLSDIPSFAEAYVKVIGLPFPIFFSYLAAYTELLASPLVALGLFTRPAALGLFSTMLVAMYHHVKVAGLSIPYLELSTLYAAVFLFFTINGAGLFSVDALLSGWLTAMWGGTPAKSIADLENAYQLSETTSNK